MGRRDPKHETPDLSALALTASQAWRRQADAQCAYLKAVEDTLKVASRVIDAALTQGGYVKAEYGSREWRQAGFFTRHVPSRCEIFVEVIGQPDFMTGRHPDEVLRSWIRIISLHLRAPTFLISHKPKGAPHNGGPYLSIIFQHGA